MTGEVHITTAVRVIAFAGARLVLKVEGDTLRFPQLDELEAAIGRDLLYSAGLPAAEGGLTSESLIALPESLELPGDFRLDGLRVAYHALSEADFRAAGRARQIIEWHRTHRFCSRCGTATERELQQDSMTCPSCGQRHFPRLAPAVIVLVQRGREALLGRSPHFTKGVYSTLAGFVEPGESLEDAVRREVFEETNIRVSAVQYHSSQPWPFPSSLMLGFIAEADRSVAQEILLNDGELEDAQWFTRKELRSGFPKLPFSISIARRLVDGWIDAESNG